MERCLKRVLVLSDGKPGHYNQSFGIAKALDEIETIETDWVQLRFRMKFFRSIIKYCLKYRKIRSFFEKKYSLKYVPFFYTLTPKTELSTYDYIISTGGDTAFLNAWISISNPETYSIYNGNPRGLNFLPFNAITTVIDLGFENQIILDVAPTMIQISNKKNDSIILEKFGLSQKSYFVLLIGGNGAGYQYMDADIERLIKQSNRISKKLNISWLVTTSRRTTIEHEKRLKIALSAAYFVDYHREPQKVMKDFLALAEIVFVTEESSSMISEAIASGKPVVTLYPKEMKPDSNYKKILQKFENEKRIIRTTIEQFGEIDYRSKIFSPIQRDSVTEIADKLKEVFKKDV